MSMSGRNLYNHSNRGLKMKTFLLSLFLGLVTLNPITAIASDTGWLFQPLYTQGTDNPTNTAKAGNKGSLYFNKTNKSVFMKMDDFVTTNWFALTGGNIPQSPYYRACTITSAAASVAVHCLAAGDVGTLQVPYLYGFHGKVNGGTNWATTVGCALKDTTGVTYASIATTAMTGNAFIVTNTSGVTLSSPLSLGTGGTAGAGIDVVCDQAGTGSDFVLTLEGYLQ